MKFFFQHFFYKLINLGNIAEEKIINFIISLNMSYIHYQVRNSNNQLQILKNSGKEAVFEDYMPSLENGYSGTICKRVEAQLPSGFNTSKKLFWRESQAL